MSQLTSSQQQAVDFAVLTQLSVEAKGDRIKTMILNTAMENHPSDVLPGSAPTRDIEKEVERGRRDKSSGPALEAAVREYDAWKARYPSEAIDYTAINERLIGLGKGQDTGRSQ